MTVSCSREIALIHLVQSYYDKLIQVAHWRQECHNSKSVIFQKLLKVLKCYIFLWVQRRHNCSPATSFSDCVMRLYLLKVHLQTFLSIPVTQKFQILSCDTLVANEHSVLQQCFSNLFACSPLLLSKNNHRLSHPSWRKYLYSVQIKCIQNYKLTSENNSRSRDNALDDLTVIKMAVARFMCTGSFLMICSYSRTK
jgi:hypothetical protein